ncbi:PEPxxWA-CTERM sorting domain-containing protein [Sphingomonas sp. JC676]|uniref:PEPxxWA-CTERM sorting domain-containing protein n=1 Tax=Sphingomonas sp. JC676 TaxID=2768065 RepID=UPI0016586DDC|nr:PEPxxWA-CTERM sorting domain-containing protein [Sphingomonas sp. JC676]MBC9032441.1 PEPxxWA-CTERM sorting domain-containing protein [Sphingomonas sp. JC676]
MSFRKSIAANIIIGAFASCAIASTAQAQNLLVNGGFEDSDSGFVTPTGWTNIGPSNGVVPYSAIGPGLTPYEGDNFYTIGGLGTNGISAIGWGIGQSVATTIGNTYRLTFGFSDENGPGLETVLGVGIGGTVTQYTLTATNAGFFARQFQTATIDYIATGALTNISFTLLATNELGIIGNNDPLIDGVIFEQIAVGNPGGVPEPASWATMIGGFGFAGAAMRRRSAGRIAIA